MRTACSTSWTVRAISWIPNAGRFQRTGWISTSALSKFWKFRLKHNARHRSGECKTRFSPGDVVVALEDQDMTFLPMTMRHAASELEVPLVHEDPFNELLLVQAQEEGLRLLAVDRSLVDHPLAVTVQELE